jgi:exodeoxyribonuclease V beta subunit
MPPALAPFDARTVPLDGPVLCEASAGTGKTHAITTLWVRLLIERALEPHQILVVTFTEAATAELRGRVRERLRHALGCSRLLASGGAPPAGDAVADLLAERHARGLGERDRARLDLARREIDAAAIHTIHAFCHRVLQESAFETGVSFHAELVPDPSPLREELLHDFFARELEHADPVFVTWLRRTKLTDRSWSELCSRVLRQPTMPIVGAPTPTGPLDARPLERAFGEARAAWDRERVERKLLTSIGLSRQQYREASIPGWCDRMDALLAAEREPTSVLGLAADFDKLDRFCASTLAVSCRRGGTPPVDPFFDACEALAREAHALETRLDAEIRRLKARLAEWLRAEATRRKAERRELWFDDLVHRLRDAVVRGDALARLLLRRHPAALIDEFQDTDPAQWEIFERVWIAGGGALFLIGDPKQAVYSFRGADLFAYLRAARTVPGDRRHTMLVNWRSDPSLVAAVGALFGRGPEGGGPERPFFLSDVRFTSVRARPEARDLRGMEGPPLEILLVRRAPGQSSAEAGERLAALCAAEIAAFLERAHIGERAACASDVAVLTRTNQQAFEIQAALRRRGVHAVVLGDVGVFEQPEAAELATVLGAVAEPTHTEAVRAALVTSLFALDADALARMEACDPRDEGSWDEAVARFRRWNGLWASRGLVPMLAALMAEARVARHLLALDDGERRMTNLLHLVELCQRAARERHLGPAGVVHWLAAERRAAERSKVRPEEAQIRLESDAAAVKITTVHRSKGLEFPVVFCPHLWHVVGRPEDDVVFHDPRAGDRLTLSLAPDDARARTQAAREELAEDLRLAYVAVTRARHRAVLFWGAFRGFEASALAWLLATPPLAHRSEDPLEVSQQVKGMSDDALRLALDRLVAAAGGTVAVREVAGPPGEAGRAREPVAEPRQPGARERALPALEPRRVREPIERWRRMSSFTALVSRATAVAPEATEGRDRDQGDEELAAGARPLSGAAERAADDASPLAAFPRGAKAGNFFHEVLERVDFTEREGPPLEEMVRDKLLAHGHPLETWLEPVSTALRGIFTTPLDETERPPRLAEVPRTHRWSELEFHLPVGSVGAPPRARPPRGTQLALRFAPAAAGLRAHDLARVFADHPSEAVPPDYADAVARLGFAPLEGFVKGYVDLVFAHRGRYYLCDYKTSHLGDALESYAAPKLRAAMARGHYYLQYHLYALALHRHLRRRLPRYRYERDFGGVHYLFLRGMTPAAGARAGVFFEKPPEARLDALGELCGGGP